MNLSCETEQLTELDEKFAIAFSLVRRQRQNAGHIVVFRTLLLFTEVTNYVETSSIHLGHNVEQERIRVVVQSLVVEKQFRKEAQILSVGLVLATINFKEGDCLLAVDFIAGWMAQVALCLPTT